MAFTEEIFAMALTKEIFTMVFTEEFSTSHTDRWRLRYVGCHGAVAATGTLYRGAAGSWTPCGPGTSSAVTIEHLRHWG